MKLIARNLKIDETRGNNCSIPDDFQDLTIVVPQNNRFQEYPFLLRTNHTNLLSSSITKRDRFN